MRVGDQVGDFTATDQHGDERSLSEFVGEGPVVVYFYPKAMTPG